MGGGSEAHHFQLSKNFQFSVDIITEVTVRYMSFLGVLMQWKPYTICSTSCKCLMGC